MKRIRFTTETGSKYEIDCDRLVASRVWATEESGPVRMDKTISIVEVPAVAVGYRVHFVCPPYPGATVMGLPADLRIVLTSRVVSMAVSEQADA